MDDTLQDALQLLLVGMTTVALILGLVVLTGRLLIAVVNRTTPKRRSGPTNRPAPPPGDHTDPKVVAVLAGVVEHITHGKGHIKSIDRSQ